MISWVFKPVTNCDSMLHIIVNAFPLEGNHSKVMHPGSSSDQTNPTSYHQLLINGAFIQSIATPFSKRTPTVKQLPSSSTPVTSRQIPRVATTSEVAAFTSVRICRKVSTQLYQAPRLIKYVFKMKANKIYDNGGDDIFNKSQALGLFGLGLFIINKYKSINVMTQYYQDAIKLKEMIYVN